MRLVELVLDANPPLEEMANLYKDDTGLDYPIWIGTIGGQHGPRVKVSNMKQKWRANNNFVCTLEKEPRVVTPETCKLSAFEVKQVFKWIEINFDDLMTLWWMFEHGALEVRDEDTGTVIQYDTLIDNLKKV